MESNYLESKLTNKMVTPEDIPEFEFKLKGVQPPELINEYLKKHQLVANWGKQKLMNNLHVWAERFIFEFELKIEDTPALMVDKLSQSTYGHFRPGRNGFGLRNEIAINEIYIEEQKYWETLGTLLHELLHAEQEIKGNAGKNNYHNKNYKDRAASFGLIVDSWGHTSYAPAPTPFWDILKKYGVEMPDTFEAVEEQTAEPGNSKLKLWICECRPNPVKVRVAIQDFRARCLKCNTIFRRSE